MSTPIPKNGVLSPIQLLSLSNEIKTILQQQTDCSIGNMELVPIVQLMIETIGPIFFNQGLEKALAIFNERALNVEDDIRVAEMPSTLK